MEMTLGAKASLSASIEGEVTVGIKTEIFGGLKFESTNGLSIEMSKGGKATICEQEDLIIAKEKEEEALESYKITSPSIKLTAVTEVEIDSPLSITLKCGGSEITLGPAEVKIKSPTITIEGSGTADLKSDGMTTVKGSLIKLDGQIAEG
jgi:uncharacterized protein (DUF2345 family)